MSEFLDDIPNIRRTNHNKQTFYSVVDICTAVSDSKNPTVFWYTFQKNNEWVNDFVVKLDMPSRSLNQQPTYCANAEGILRIICSMRGKKADKIKACMAKALSDKLKQTKGTNLVKFIESIE